MTLDKTRQKVVKPNSLVYVELTSANLTLFLTRHTETQQSNGEQSHDPSVILSPHKLHTHIVRTLPRSSSYKPDGLLGHVSGYPAALCEEAEDAFLEHLV